MRIEKSLGVTPTERLLTELCDRSFLKLWTYPNPYGEDGKELCDLLAVFENEVFIFFDREKSITDLNRGASLTWERWKRRVIDAQIASARGAERYIRSRRRIYLDAKRTTPLPVQVHFDNLIVHKIVVAHGARQACESFSKANVYGSLGAFYSDQKDPLTLPFMLDLKKSDPVHVFDSYNLPIVLSELDTITDLSDYLKAKVEAIKTYDCLSYCGEEDLLGHYFANFDRITNRHRIGPPHGNYNAVMIGEGEWKDFIATSAYKAKKEADRVSYLWDSIIQRTCQNALEGTMLGDSTPLRGKSAIHEMAKEPRFVRRALSDRIIRVIRGFPDTHDPFVRNVSLFPSFFPAKAYVFLQVKVTGSSIDDPEYRGWRHGLLEIACGAARNKLPQYKTIIGISIDAPKFVHRNAEDFLLMECDDWPDDRADFYRSANEDLHFFQTQRLERFEERVVEFPNPL
jgi:hypothetical protein